MTKGFRRALTGVVLVTSLGFGFGAAAQTAITVVIPNPSAVNNFPLHVAIGEGYFAEEGLDVTVEAVNGSASVLQAMAAGQAEIGNPGPGPVLAARSRGEDVVFVYNQAPKSIFGLVVAQESAIKSPADLKGAVIGVGTADGTEVAFTRGIMNDLGLAEGTDYEFLTVGDGGTAVAAIISEEVSAYAASVADVAIIESKGIDLREITPEEKLGLFGNGWAVTRAYLDANPKVVEGFGRSIARATAFGVDPANREAVLAHAAVGNPQEAEDRPLAEAMLTAIGDRMTPVDTSLPWGYQPPEGWVRWHESQIATGGIPAPLDNLEAAYTNRFVEAWNKGL